MAHTAMPGTVKAHANAPVADADLALGGGKMTLPFGELLLQAAGPLLFGQFGGATDLKGALHNLVDCPRPRSPSRTTSAATSRRRWSTRCAPRRSTSSPTRYTSQIDAIAFKDVQISGGTALPARRLAVEADRRTTSRTVLRQGKWDWSFTVSGSDA